MKIDFNAPLILSFTLICAIFFGINELTNHTFNKYIALSPFFDFRIHTYITHIFGHQSINHLINNMTFILLLGPFLEEKYGVERLGILIIITAIITGILDKLFFSTGLIGASGIVFLFIILSSFTNARKGSIPVTFILVFLLFIGKEVYASLQDDNISQFAHIIGGICGGIAGFVLNKGK